MIPEIVAVKKFLDSEEEYSVVVEWQGRDFFFTVTECKDELQAYQKAKQLLEKRMA